ncbi:MULTISPECIES: hypothetical protein [Sphingobacterium]|uniref:hypothetical protein n=1 Tax=Sphingobacterium TaxID=28453 RepID=UPI0013DD833B|nr:MULTISPECIES: hypothetical protein [unclassified Sphingobacterium]
MQEQFDTLGFSKVETRLLSLSASGRRLETDYLRAKPVEWIDENFILDTQEYDQLQSIDPIFLQRMATAVADSWDQGQLVSFYKESPPQDGADSPKDIIFSRQATQSLTVGEEATGPLDQVAIWIRYR